MESLLSPEQLKRKQNRESKNVIPFENPITHSIEQLTSKFSLNEFMIYLHTLKDRDSFTKLFTFEIDDKLKAIIEMTAVLRQDVSKLNKLPDYMKRKNQDEIDVKSIGAEVSFSFLMRALNKSNKYAMSVPELATVIPNKSKPDFVIESSNLTTVFDMKSQCKSKTVNINKIAHDRAMGQGLNFYIVGFVNSDNLMDLKTVTYYHLPLDFFERNRKFVDDGIYCQKDHKNDYYEIKLKHHSGSIFANHTL